MVHPSQEPQWALLALWLVQPSSSTPGDGQRRSSQTSTSRGVIIIIISLSDSVWIPCWLVWAKQMAYSAFKGALSLLLSQSLTSSYRFSVFDQGWLKQNEWKGFSVCWMFLNSQCRQKDGAHAAGCRLLLSDRATGEFHESGRAKPCVLMSYRRVCASVLMSIHKFAWVDADLKLKVDAN